MCCLRWVGRYLMSLSSIDIGVMTYFVTTNWNDTLHTHVHNTQFMEDVNYFDFISLLREAKKYRFLSEPLASGHRVKYAFGS